MGFFDKLFGQSKSGNAGEFQPLLDRSMEELRLKTAAHDRLWHLSEANWAVNKDTGTIRFNLPDGTTATAPVQIIGTYNNQDGSWLWAWDHPSVQIPLQEHARAVLAYGEKHGIDELTARKLSCSTDRAWELCALACHLAGAQGAYRGPAGSALVYMTFGNVSLTKENAQTNVDPKAFRPIVGLKQTVAPDVLEFLRQYFALNFQIEKAYNDESKLQTGFEAAEQAIAKMGKVYQQYWRRNDDDFEPGSVGWPSDYDLDRITNWRVFHLDSNNSTYRVAYVLKGLEWAYDVKRFDDGLKIVDRVFE